MEHTLIVAGIGPGDPDYILPKAQKAIEGAHYLVGGRRALSDYAKPSQETYPVTGKLSLLADWLEEALKKDDVVVMAAGALHSDESVADGLLIAAAAVEYPFHLRDVELVGVGLQDDIPSFEAYHADGIDKGMVLKGFHRVDDDRDVVDGHKLLGNVLPHSVACSSCCQ